VRVDYHTHSTYSDGRFMWSMCRAAEEADLNAIGFADHCNVSPRDRQHRAKTALGFNLDITYERRREAIETMNERFDIAVRDGVEMDFDSRDIDTIAEFLDEADFEYAIGSVHHLDGTNVHVEPYFAKKSDEERADLVDEFYSEAVALIESELFDIAAHVDLVERNPALRDFANEDHFHRVAEAAENSRTLLEINAGRVLDEYGEFHPAPNFMEILDSYDLEFVLGTDSHTPEEIPERVEELEKFATAHSLETAELNL
jgi:histidinol-phosphatase (PHP family)